MLRDKGKGLVSLRVHQTLSLIPTASRESDFAELTKAVRDLSGSPVEGVELPVFAGDKHDVCVLANVEDGRWKLVRTDESVARALVAVVKAEGCVGSYEDFSRLTLVEPDLAEVKVLLRVFQMNPSESKLRLPQVSEEQVGFEVHGGKDVAGEGG